MISVHACLRSKGILLCCRSITLSNQLPWVSDRCKGLVFFFVNFIRDTGQDITPYDPTHCPLLTEMTLAFCQ